MPIEFESPFALFLALLLPLFPLMLWRSLMDNSRGQRIASSSVRVLVAALVILALADTQWLARERRVAVLVLGDVSDSVPAESATYLRETWDKLGDAAPPSAQMGLGLFAASPVTALPVESSPEWPETLPQPPDKGATRIDEALTFARESLPAHTLNRVVIVSDGNQTSGDVLAAAKRFAAQGIRVYTIPYPEDNRPEVLLEDLVVPAEVKQGQSFSVTAIAQSTIATEGVFTLYRNGFKVEERTLELKPGATPLTFTESDPADGAMRYELRVTPKDDTFADNNTASGAVFVSGEPRILLLENDEREARHFARALESERFRVEVREGRGLPDTLEELAAFDAVIFSDVPATDLSLRRMELLKSYVEDLGGGFMMLGGENSFGLGGYYRTPVEDILPVKMHSEKKKDTPSLALAIVVDKSGSMNGEKIELAKEAAIAAVELLTPDDFIGVVGFDGEVYWVVDMQGAGSRGTITQTISALEAGGGTNMGPAVEAAREALVRTSAAIKHAVILTDGHTQPDDFEGIVGRMRDGGITVSTVGVGEGADIDLLESMARWGRGRHYFTADPYDIPQIFAKETMSASKSSMIEEPFLAQVFQPAPIIQGLDWGGAPFLFGYVATKPKATAELPLVSERGDPLLAVWRFGLGKTAAFTSDAKSRWAADWLGWPGYGVFWAQVTRDIMRTTRGVGNETAITREGDTGRIAVDSVDSNGNFVNGLSSSARLIGPDKVDVEVPLQQTAPGRYEASLPMENIGTYLVNVRQATAGDNPEIVSSYTRTHTISYQPEYRRLGTNTGLLREIASLSGGKFDPSPEEVFAIGDDDALPVRRPLWPWLLGTAAALFVIDVALRRLDLAGRSLFGAPARYG